MTDAPKIPDTDLIQMVAACTEDARAPSPVADCGITVHIAFFFDGRLRHGETDEREGRPSNVYKLYLSHPDADRDQPMEKYRRFYIPGLGTPFDPSFAAAARGTGAVAGRVLTDEAKGAVKDQAQNAAKTVLWDSPGTWWHEAKEDLAQLWKHPLKTVRGAVVGAAVNVGLRAGAEATPGVRDDPRMVDLLLSGADTRMAAASEWFWSALEEIQNKSRLSIKAVRLSVFGFDTGGVLARGFVRNVLDGKAPFPIAVVFAGLFDSVGRSRPQEWTKLVPGASALDQTNSEIDDGGPLHTKVKRALHLVAAHERRYTHVARLLGPLQPDWREVLVPGNSEDVGGGMRPGDQGRPSADFALTALYQMHRAACFAGVPLVPIENLSRQLGQKIAAIYASRDYVRLDPRGTERAQLPKVTPVDGSNARTAHSLAQWYRRHVVRDCAPNREGFLAHMRIYMQWLGYMYDAYHDVLRSNENSHVAIGGDVVDRLGRVFGSEPDAKREGRERVLATLKAEREAMERTLGWLDDVREESNEVSSRLKVYGARAGGTVERSDEWSALLRTWQVYSQSPYLSKADREKASALPAPPPEVHALFGSFLHDPLAWNRQGNSVPMLAVQPLRFFDTRLIEQPEA